MNKEAFYYYRLVLGKSINQNVILSDLREIAENAYYGVINLMHSNDEYIWESGLTITDCYGELCKDWWYTIAFEKKRNNGLVLIFMVVLNISIANPHADNEICIETHVELDEKI